MPASFTLANFYSRLTIEAAEKLSESAKAFAADPSGGNAARLKADADRWADYQAVSRAVSAHNV